MASVAAAAAAGRRRGVGAGPTVGASGWWLCVLLALLAAQAVAGGPGAFYPSGRYGKRVETEGPLLPAGRGAWAAGRAGRSGTQLTRADRFFIGSRYGKRAGSSAFSDVIPLTQAQAQVHAQAVAEAEAAAAALQQADSAQAQAQGQMRSQSAGPAQQGPQPSFVALPDMWALPAVAPAAPDFASSEGFDLARERTFLLTHGTGGHLTSPTSCVYTGIADLYRCVGRNTEKRRALLAPPARGHAASVAPTATAGLE